ncbi:MAG: efflux RND transporter periplasmic adaptor subunit [Eubacterium sp.]|nr:efflux RND transporter periplasmic adaptor subunit [Eubacterium sp.]
MTRRKKVTIILIIIAAAAAGLLLLFRFMKAGAGAGSTEAVYAVPIRELVDGGSASGVINRYAGVVEAEETWSVNKNEEVQVKEILVKVGQEVKAGDPLFTYDTEKYQADLSQAKIDLQRLNNELSSLQGTIDSLTAQKAKTTNADDLANLTIQIQDQQLSLSQKKLDVQSKQIDIDKLQKQIDTATVTSKIDGIVRTINENGSANATTSDSGQDSSAFITVMKAGSIRIKAKINEMNIGEISEGIPVIIRSRVDDTFWRGTVSKIDTENGSIGSGESMYGNVTDGYTSSTSYPFYVTPESADGLMMGQHVYVEPDYGQEDGGSGNTEDAEAGSETVSGDSTAAGSASVTGTSAEDKNGAVNTAAEDGVTIPEYMIDTTDPEHPFVWKAEGDRLKKVEVTGEITGDPTGLVNVTGDLTADDALAFPDPTLTEGTRTEVLP